MSDIMPGPQDHKETSSFNFSGFHPEQPNRSPRTGSSRHGEGMQPNYTSLYNQYFPSAFKLPLAPFTKKERIELDGDDPRLFRILFKFSTLIAITEQRCGILPGLRTIPEKALWLIDCYSLVARYEVTELKCMPKMRLPPSTEEGNRVLLQRTDRDGLRKCSNNPHASLVLAMKSISTCWVKTTSSKLHHPDKRCTSSQAQSVPRSSKDMNTSLPSSPQHI
ncbi:hypothetical protein BCR34DRAFT_592476 [Clohesyomyces aquaticus]|uniref:Uncharacterized protein n=1 Tax=Clohesyomyces aquaticus TaxID=1231657 RepID=A0A1Y1YRU6_9PLEO|nr:hypothetical protein BCR34DRAFT_592476 [Clohesyomyces aquaticus]